MRKLSDGIVFGLPDKANRSMRKIGTQNMRWYSFLSCEIIKIFDIKFYKNNNELIKNEHKAKTKIPTTTFASSFQTPWVESEMKNSIKVMIYIYIYKLQNSHCFLVDGASKHLCI